MQTITNNLIYCTQGATQGMCIGFKIMCVIILCLMSRFVAENLLQSSIFVLISGIQIWSLDSSWYFRSRVEIPCTVPNYLISKLGKTKNSGETRIFIVCTLVFDKIDTIYKVPYNMSFL